MWDLLPSTSSPNSKPKSQEGKALKESSKETVPGGRGRVPVSRGRWCAGRSCHPSPRAPAAAYQSSSPCPLCAEVTGRAQGDLRLSWTSTLITCTGWRVSCSLEFRSFVTGLYTVSSQVRIRSNRSLQLWNFSGPCLIRLFLSNIRQNAVVGDPPTISAPTCSAKSCA